MSLYFCIEPIVHDVKYDLEYGDLERAQERKIPTNLLILKLKSVG